MRVAHPVTLLLHYVFALAIVLYITVGTIVSLIRIDNKATFASARRRIHIVVLVLVVVSHIANAGISVAQYDPFDDGQAQLVQLVISTIAWSWVAFRPTDPTYILFGVAFISAIFETALLVFALLNHLDSALTIADIVIQGTRLLLLLIVLASTLRNLYRQFSRKETDFTSVESSYRDSLDSESGAEVASHPDDSAFDSDDEEDTASIKRRRAARLKETGGWLAYLKDFSIFLPYLIPKNNRKVQLCILVSLFCVVCNRVTTVLVPRQIGIVTDHVLNNESPYEALAIWFLLSLMDEYRGMALIERFVKIPIQQFSLREINNASFNHVMTLSMDFHSDRDAAEVMKAIEQGSALNSILETVAVDLLPFISDIFIAVGLFWWKFNVYVGLAVLISAIVFVSVEVTLLRRNMQNKRDSSKTEREESRVMHQAVQGWQTVTYFNMFGFERRRYAQAVDAHLDASRKFEILEAVTDSVLESLEPITFVILAGLVLYDVAHGQSSAGDFVFVLQCWQALVWPIKLLSWKYKQILGFLVDAERLLALLQTKPSVADKPDARELTQIEGRVVFDKVGFHYDPRKPTIQNLSLSASPGQTVAFVGATGAGKSTITKLLLRFYDVNSGSITVDDHDIRDITLNSLRSGLGVVPQDPLLFNASILENLRYARPDATDEEIFAACRKAAIHDKIAGFVDGYETKVGEQGIKLSGGEIQRLAIARVFLKNPPILILDEATSAVDTETEHSIQKALDGLKQGRTTFVIAHRLSTIVGADKILVISDGQVVESGTHAELLSANGSYSGLWSKQSKGMIVDEEE
ncbi:Heavy metal tolerance protein [Paramyrothecium foliicola]|nr:Heavy metal tolerance protein [Paramyrothecium foliicola]